MDPAIYDEVPCYDFSIRHFTKYVDRNLTAQNNASSRDILNRTIVVKWTGEGRHHEELVSVTDFQHVAPSKKGLPVIVVYGEKRGMVGKTKNVPKDRSKPATVVFTVDGKEESHKMKTTFLEVLIEKEIV